MEKLHFQKRKAKNELFQKLLPETENPVTFLDFSDNCSTASATNNNGMNKDELLAKVQKLEKNESLMKKKELQMRLELTTLQYLFGNHER